jgi:hypothetical protein
MVWALRLWCLDHFRYGLFFTTKTWISVINVHGLNGMHSVDAKLGRKNLKGVQNAKLLWVDWVGRARTPDNCPSTALHRPRHRPH